MREASSVSGGTGPSAATRSDIGRPVILLK
jgi:hypothetical protein